MSAQPQPEVRIVTVRPRTVVSVIGLTVLVLAVLLTGMARVANLHAIGILVVDEIQHVKISRGEGSVLLNFLVTLRNTIGVSLLMIGTMSALCGSLGMRLIR